MSICESQLFHLKTALLANTNYLQDTPRAREMSEQAESPAQRQARIRREKREAKINANAQDRLDKITKLSGRTPESSKSPGSTYTGSMLTQSQCAMRRPRQLLASQPQPPADRKEPRPYLPKALLSPWILATPNRRKCRKNTFAPCFKEDNSNVRGVKHSLACQTQTTRC
jgi:hypothetical protein